MDLYEASRALSRINLNLGDGMREVTSYWCRVVVAEREMQNLKTHRHSFFELHLCLEGEGRYEVEGREILLQKSCFLLLPPSICHRIISEPDGFRKLVWGFDVKSTECSAALCACNERTGTYQANDEMLSAIDIILKNAFEKKYGYYDVIKGQLSNIFASVVREATDLSEEDSFGKHPSLVISEIKSYLSDNLSLSPTTSEVAYQFLKSPGALDKLCMSECGMTVSELKRQLRFERIRELLSETDYNLDRIADICGFSDRYTMGKFFKKMEGVPPGEFRRSIKR